MALLDNKTAIVTGGTRGIGRGVALRLAQEGARVVVNYVSDDKSAATLTQEAADKGYTIHCRKASVTDSGQVEDLIAYTLATFAGIDILVNNAGIKKDGLLMTMPEEAWDDVMAVNLKGLYLMTKQVVRTMIGQRSGRIINMTSLTGVAGMAGQSNYAASKGGIISFSKTMAQELGRYGITVNALAPGFIETEMLDSVPDKVLKKAKKEIPLRRLGTVNEVADTTLFLASAMGSYITGHVLNVNGGLYM
ncbi:MAG: 3-oxoacyl-[acyl-carrier-protein] reductase [Thermodesulfobacteriota bacterium]